MAYLCRRSPVQHPSAVVSPTERARRGELSHRLGDRRSVSSDQVREALVRQRQRHDDAVRHDTPPPLRQMPESQKETIVDTLVMGDRKRDRQVVGPAGTAGKELDAELGPRVHANDQPVVEHGKPRRLKNHPADLRVHV